MGGRLGGFVGTGGLVGLRVVGGFVGGRVGGFVGTGGLVGLAVEGALVGAGVVGVTPLSHGSSDSQLPALHSPC